MMLLVPQTPNGEIKWDECFEVTSLEEFVNDRNRRFVEVGTPNHRLRITSQQRVDYIGEGGILVESYRACERNPLRLV